MPANSAASYWSNASARRPALAGRALRFGVVLAAHALLLWVGLELAARPEARAAVADLVVRLIEQPPAVKEAPPLPPPPKPKSAPPKVPPPIMAAAPEAAASSATFAVPPQPPAPSVIEVAPAPPTPVVIAARFDADYLSNPKPAYPAASRRLGEEGKVVLRVRVSAAGAALAVEVKQSSGFTRLDEAARSAVERWRFVPARRGDEAVDAWVAVPIVFSLQTS
jgi:periplasmic protein TonB